ncbi:MAG: DUF4159 domain-containing protein, partial [Oceanipulchritudo sp.]
MTQPLPLFPLLCLFLLSSPLLTGQAPDTLAPDDELRVVQLVEGDPLQRNHPAGLPSLLSEIARSTPFAFSPDPVFIQSFADPRLFESPVAYVNFADRSDWELSAAELEALRTYLNSGGFLYFFDGA